MSLLLSLVSGAALVQGPPGTVSGAMNVGATVVRDGPAPSLAIDRGSVSLRNVAGVAVGVRGGILRRVSPGNVSIVAGPAGNVVVTLTY